MNSPKCPYEWSKCPVMQKYMQDCPYHKDKNSGCPFNAMQCPYLKKAHQDCPYLKKVFPTKE